MQNKPKNDYKLCFLSATREQSTFFGEKKKVAISHKNSSIILKQLCFLLAESSFRTLSKCIHN